MTDEQVYIIFSLGCLLALAVMLFGNNIFITRVIGYLKLLLLFKILLSVACILILPFIKPNPSGRLPYPGLRRSSTWIGIFFLGIFLTYLAFIWLRRFQRKNIKILVSPQVQDFDRLFRWAMALIFIWSGIVKWVYPALDAHFFSISGYGTRFFAFITAVEILGGIGLLFRKTALLSSVLLIADMAGATYTHYHNYFSSNLPDPFSNSIPSLSLQPYLITILVIAISATVKRYYTQS
jgi:uncharacterized membrane protein YphA (DoxX/SURF4 family)